MQERSEYDFKPKLNNNSKDIAKRYRERLETEC